MTGPTGPLRLSEVAEGAGGVLEPAAAGGVAVTGLGFDSRALAPGELFVALPGTRVDGADYVPDAFRAGAAAALAGAGAPAGGGPVVRVPDPAAALVRLATALHRRLAAAGTRTVAVTGSNGKTTVKDLLAHLLARLDGGPGRVASPPGSYNNELGVPVTVVRAAAAASAPAHLVLEMGARGEGHIAELCRIAPPDVGAVLMVGSAHLSEFGSRERLARAKSELVRGLAPAGVAVLNADDPVVAAMAPLAPGRVVTFGTGPDAEVRALDPDEDDLARARFTLAVGGDRAEVRLALTGRHHLGNALAAAAVAHVEGMGVAAIAAALGEPAALSPHRMAVTRRGDGVVVVDDAYNASPESTAAALQTLAVLGRGRRTWAVLGEMRELGPEAAEAHDRIGRLAVRLNVDRLVAVGEGARAVHLAAGHEGSWGGESEWVPDAAAASAVVAAGVAPGDVVLVKASNAGRLWRVADDLLAAAT